MLCELHCNASSSLINPLPAKVGNPQRHRRALMTAAVAFRRGRRHDDRCLVSGLSSSSVMASASLLVLLFLSALSFLAPQLVDNPSFLNPNWNRGELQNEQKFTDRAPLSTLLFVNFSGLGKNVVSAESFVVPTGGGASDYDLWRSKHAKYYYGCSNSTGKFPRLEAITDSKRYLMIATSGGLNQQRTGIIDAVVAARILNATLVVPKLDQKSFWKDASDFTDIFDVDWFISSLLKDVRIVKQLPRKGGKAFASPYTMRVPRKCTPKCYQSRVLPVLMKKHVVQLTKFDYRLANNLDTDLQKLRCRVNHHALKFTDLILEMGNILIQRMRERSKHFIALHLRFEPDMLAFSGCDYGGGEKERIDLSTIRKRWKTLHTKNPEKERRHGKCPLTPEEVGLMLRALGFGSDVHIYVASGEVYGGKETLAPLKALFPNFHSKETLATKEELAPFSLFSSRMAALDFMVCDGSDAFVTNNNGNMAKILAGRRRYFGHRRTIRPNSKKLYSLFLNRTSMNWESFASKVRTYQIGFVGEPNEIKPGRGEFHENPLACICESSEAMAIVDKSKDFGKIISENSHRSSFETYEHAAEEETEWADVDDIGDESLKREMSNRNASDYNLFMKSEEPELDIFSD